MSRPKLLALLGLALLLPLLVFVYGTGGGDQPIVTVAGIDPDYRELTIPPNLAPLNFRIGVAGYGYEAVLDDGVGQTLRVHSRRPLIQWPAGRWRRLLEASRGRTLALTVRVRDGAAWRELLATTWQVAQEPIDPYLHYRNIRPLHNTWGAIEIRERDLTSFADRVLVAGRQYQNGCANCHLGASGRADRFVLGIRSEQEGSGTLLAIDGEVLKLKNKIGYPAWRQSGELLVFTVNQVRQWFHPAADEVREVLDLQSGLAFWRVGSEAIETIPAMCPPDRLLTFPAWSPDGEYLYYCSGPIRWPTGREIVPPPNHGGLQYDLMRLAFRDETWGEPELVLSAAEAGGSVMEPRVAPDGSVIVTLCDQGGFPIHRPESDLYRVRPGGTPRFEKLSINSDRAETWHSISQNGAWMVFSSKRRDGLFVKPYLTYLGGTEPTRPVLLPVEDPRLWDTRIESYNTPELAVEPLPFSPHQLGEAIRSGPGIELAMPDVYAPPEEKPAKDDWRQR